MSQYVVEIRVTPRRGLLDPQGKAIQHALDSLGFGGVDEVRAGRLLVIELEADSRDEAEVRAARMCEKLLANPVTEDFAVEVARAAPRSGAAT